MLARTARSPAWTKQAYVCRACRRQWQIERAYQRRWNSQNAQSSGLLSDEWFAINDINESFGDHKIGSPQRPKEKEEGVQKNSSKDNRDGRVAGPDGVAGQDFGSLQSSLSDSLPAADRRRLKETRVANEISKRKDAGFKAAFLSGESRHRDRSTARTGAVAPNEDIMATLMRDLQAEARIKAVEQDLEIGRSLGEVEDDDTESKVSPTRRDAGPRPFPNFRGGPSQTVASAIAPASKASEVPSSDSAPPKVWKAKTSPAERGLGGSITPSDLSGRPTSLLDRHRETQPRNAWGASDSASSSLPSKVTYKSLSEADRTSAPKQAAGTPTGARPFGLAAKVKAMWRGISQPTAQDGSQPSANQKHSPKAEQPAGIDSLRSRLLSSSELSGSSSGDGESTVRRDDSEEIAPVDNAATESLQKLHASRLRTSDNAVEELSQTSAETVVYSDAEERRLQQRIRDLESKRPSGRNRATRKDRLRRARQLLSKLRASRGESLDGSDGATAHASPSRPDPRESMTMSAVAEEQSDNNGGSANMVVVGNDSADLQASGASTTPVTGKSLGEAMRTGTANSKTTHRLRRLTRASNEVVLDMRRSATIESEVATQHTDPVENDDEAEESSQVDVLSVQPSELQVQPLNIPQPPVPYLEYGLDRVLFNPGVYQLQDAASRVYNFDPYLQKIMPVEQFDFNSLKEYKTSSEDTALSAIAKQESARYIGSTSSMTGSLAHFHYLISNWRPLGLDMLSYGYAGGNKPPIAEFTKINKAPSAIFLRWQDGCYAIDADKEFDSGNVLMLLGKSLELLLTLPKDEYEKYRKSDPRMVPEEQRLAPESYQYSTMGDFLMRSQLDAHDPRLPGNGTFDLKTRAVVSVRMASHDHEPMTGYEIYGNHGRWGSYEKEYHDMARATMLKYMLQARMGMMNGIFVAYHNVKRMFGFQYIPISEMDRILHGQPDTCLGDQEFKASLKILNDLLNKATTKYPEQSLRIHFETKPAIGETPAELHMFAEPMIEEEIRKIQDKPKEKIAEFERKIMGKEDVQTVDETDSAGKETVEGSSEVSSAGSRQPGDDATALARSRLDYKSTDTPADKPFLNEVQETETSELRPLFYAKVVVQSRVNGSIPTEGRPQNLKASDTWELDYLIREAEVSRHVWALYDDTRARRKAALHFDREEADAADGEGEGKVKETDHFIEFLKNMSRKGEIIREKQDLADAESGQPVVRVDEPLPRHREKIETLEDYLAWMYKREQA
ncbi:mRNA degradation protein pet127, mitochondrial [Cercospora beticola]|uniref:mRNA degradation protein pet127, mitochondrial n=1 Tax=Cercospora beticola TaxID=122368 RepID=A0A2G5HGZ5_CERBT|nr:mRNA degradation protein pet127, mitochondrial [Cercospora beticola]PIA91512.1 mRNA degradation protein pet127, mitochondrial [Cercospora beticola]WPB05964.1 hypothetical protein RHO25_010619 [Cercospora beticola]